MSQGLLATIVCYQIFAIDTSELQSGRNMGFLGDAECDGVKSFPTGLPCDVIPTSWGRFYGPCFLKVQIKGTFAYSSSNVSRV